MTTRFDHSNPAMVIRASGRSDSAQGPLRLTDIGARISSRLCEAGPDFGRVQGLASVGWL
jgi:hypothetical protein